MEYIVCKPFDGKAICGKVNLPVGTVCQYDQGFIIHDGQPLCVVTSENAHKHFAKNDDGKGLERGELIQRILEKMRKEEGSQERWDKVEKDRICKRYKRHDHPDNWLWNHSFYGASIENLTHIWNLISEAIDPADLGRTYTETDEPIEVETEETTDGKSDPG
jgi:hypothetical protein